MPELTTAEPKAEPKAADPPQKPTPEQLALLEEYYKDPAQLVAERAFRAMERDKPGSTKGEDGKPKVPYFASPTEDLDAYRDMGYEPVITSKQDGTKGRKTWKHKSDPLLMIEATKDQNRQELAAMLARGQLRRTLQGENTAHQTKDRDGVVHKLEPQ